MLTRINSTLGNRKGFTLVEMAIVLVIIGLIMGAVLKGGDLINSGKEKKLKQEIDAITLAFYGAQEKSIAINYTSGVLDAATVTLLKDGGYLNMFEVIGGNTLKSKAYAGTIFTIEKPTTAVNGLLANSTIIRIAGLPIEDELQLDSKFDDNNSNLGDMRQSTAATPATAYSTTDMVVRLK